MAATAADVAEVRRMTGEPTTVTYSDAVMEDVIERYPVMDAAGEAPYEDDGEVNEDWTPTYDLHAAAAQVWEWKAAGVATNFDFSADGGKFDRSQVYAQYMQQARYHRSRRKPGTITLRMEPKAPARLKDVDVEYNVPGDGDLSGYAAGDDDWQEAEE